MSRAPVPRHDHRCRVERVLTHAGDDAGGYHPLEHTVDGERVRAEPPHRPPHLARLRLAGRTARTRSSARRIRSSSRKAATSSGCISTRRTGWSYCMRTRRARSKRWIAASRSCPCRLARSTADPRLRSAWHDHAVGRSGRQERDGHRRPASPIDAAVPEDLNVHLIVDNYGTHKTARLHRGLSVSGLYCSVISCALRTWQDR